MERPARYFLYGGLFFLTGCSQPIPPEPTLIPATAVPEHTKAIPTPIRFPVQKSYIPTGWDRLIPSELDKMYEWAYKKVVFELQELRLIDYGRSEIQGQVEDERGISLRELPDFGRIGYFTGKTFRLSEKFTYWRKIQLWSDGRLDEEWAVIEDQIRSSNQADRRLPLRSYAPIAKGGFRFVKESFPVQEPQISDWALT